MRAHDFDCPSCGAPAGYYCNNPKGKTRKTPHKARGARDNANPRDVERARANLKPLPLLYHGTKNDFTVFNDAPFSIHFGTKEAAERRLEAHAVAQRTGAPRMIEARLRIQAPIRVGDPREWTSWKVYDALRYGPLRGRAAGIPKPPADGGGVEYLRQLMVYLESLGFDGVVYKNKYEDPGADSYIPFHPEQVEVLRVTPSIRPNMRRFKGYTSRMYNPHDCDYPTCGAPAGYYCNNPKGKTQKTPHKARGARDNANLRDVERARAGAKHLQGAYLSRAELPNADLTAVDLSNAFLMAADFLLA